MGAQFLKIHAGAKSLGMGSSAMAAVDDASSAFWNPGGLANISSNYSVLLSHVNWLADIKYEAGAVARQLPGIGVVALSFSYLTSGQMEITTYEEQEGTGEFFSYNDIMVGVSWARNLTYQFAFGGTIKFVRENFGFNDDIQGVPVVSQALAFDIGTQYNTGFRSLRIGLAIQNFGPELRPAGQYADIVGYDSKTQSYTTDENEEFKSYPMPMTFRAGIAAEVIDLSDQVLTVAADVLHPSDNVEQVNIGVQYKLFNVLALRGGYLMNTDAATFSAGVGFHLGFVEIDYAYLDYGILNSIQTISAAFTF